MAREIKFRAFQCGEMLTQKNSGVYGTKNFLDKLYEDVDAIMQYTGLKDKNGVEIFEGDLLLVKNIMGDDAEYFTECVFQACIDDMEGFTLRLKALHGDKENNQIPSTQKLNACGGSLCIDFRNNNYDQIAVDDTYGENHLHRNKWKENHYSNDIEIIGNIHENHELLEKKNG